MSQIILNWVNEEMNLSRKVHQIEEDFSNGFLFGQILDKYHQQLNFKQFVDKYFKLIRNDRDSRLKNYNLLFPTFMSLGIKLDPSTIKHLINKNPQIVKNLLYRLKMALQKVNYPLAAKGNKPVSLAPLKKIQNSKPSYDAMGQKFFKDVLNSTNKAQKRIDEQLKLKRFEEFKAKQDLLIKKSIQQEQMDKKRQQQIIRMNDIQELRRMKQFQQKWQKEGKLKWMKNLNIKKEREVVENSFNQTQRENKTYKNFKQQTEIQNKINQDIDQFERKIGRVDYEEGEERGVLTQPNFRERSLMSGMAFTSQIKVKKTKKSNQISQRKERDKKRRKMIVDQNKLQREIEMKSRQEDILQKLDQRSKQEKEIQYQTWRVMQCKEVIKQNREYRNQNYKRQREICQEEENRKQNILLKQMIEQHQRDIQQRKIRQKELDNQSKMEKRKTNYKFCNHLMNQIMQLADISYYHQQDTNCQELDNRFFSQLQKLFIEGQILIPRKQIRHYNGIQNLVRQKKDQSLLKSKKTIAQYERIDYYKGNRQWKIEIPRKDEPNDPEAQDALPVQPIFNECMGNIIRSIYQRYYKKEVKKEQEEFKNICVISLCGYMFSCKKTLAKYLKTVLDIDVVNIRQMLQKMIIQNMSRSDGGIFQQMINCILQGKQVPQSIIISLINQYIKNSNKDIILVDFPINVNQCIQSTYLMCPQLKYQESKLQKALKEVQKVVYMTPVKIVERTRKFCGIDLVLWLQMSQEISLDKCIGRRWKDGQMYHIRNVNKGQGMQRGKQQTACIMHNNYLRKIQKEYIKEWYSNFGWRVFDKKKVEEIRIEQEESNEKKKKSDLSEIKEKLSQESSMKVEKKEEELQFESKEEQKQQKQQQIQQEKKKEQVVGEWKQMITWNQLKQDNIEKKAVELIQKLKEIKNIHLKNKKEEAEEAEKQNDKKYRESLLQEQQRNFLCSIPTQQIHQLVDKVQIKSDIKLECISNFFSSDNFIFFWQNIQSHYLNAVHKSFIEIRQQRQLINSKFNQIRKRFIEQLTLIDGKFEMVKQFQISYNEFVQKQVDMCEEQSTKEQLHQRVEDMYQKIADIIDNQKMLLIQQRKQIMSSGFIENEMDLYMTLIKVIVQSELDKFVYSQHLITDYFTLKDGIDLKQASNQQNYQIILPDQQIVNQFGTAFPRVDALFAEAIRLFNCEQVEIDEKTKKGKKDTKKDDKKLIKKGGKELVEQKRIVTENEKQMKRILNIQKSIFRYRMAMLKQFSKKNILQMKQKANTLYQNLQDLLNYNNKVCYDALLDMSMIFRKAIENQEKIQQEIQLRYVDVIISERILNYFTPTPIIKPAKQHQEPEKFTISQLILILQELRSITEDDQTIENVNLILLLSRKTVNIEGNWEIPDTWKDKTIKNYKNIVDKLDMNVNGYVSFKLIASLIVMGNNKIVGQDFRKQYVGLFEDKKISLEQFLKQQLWFQKQENMQPQQNTNKFQRSRHLKQMLFDIFSDKTRVIIPDQNLIDLQQFIQILSLQGFNTDTNTYQDFLFGS